MMNRVIIIIALFCVTSPAFAVNVSIGGTSDLLGTTALDRPEIGGPILNQLVFDFEQTDATGAVIFFGTIEVRVRGQLLRGYTQGVFAQEYRVTSFDDNGSGFQVDALNTESVFGYDPVTGGMAIDVDFRLDDLPGVNPTTGSYLMSDLSAQFNFTTPVFAGQNTSWMFMHAPGNDIATPAGMAGAHLLIGNGSDTYMVPFPSYSLFVPLPGAVWLFASTLLLGLLSAGRKR